MAIKCFSKVYATGVHISKKEFFNFGGTKLQVYVIENTLPLVKGKDGQVPLGGSESTADPPRLMQGR